MNLVKFRPATSDDLLALVRLLADDQLGATREDANLPLNPRYVAAFTALQSDGNQLLLVAEQEKILVGCLQLSFIPGLTRKGMWRGQIEGVRIAPTHQNQGLGRRMMEHGIHLCRQRGCELVQLTTDIRRTDAHAFYEALGFEASHLGFKLSLPLLSS